MTTDQRYPLAWPAGWPRTPAQRRTRSRYEVSQARAQDALMRTLQLLRAKDVVLSTNIKLRQDGLPYASQRDPDDPAVALYFTRKGKRICVACDKYTDIRSNMRAVGLTLEAIRSIERAGSTDLLDRAFTGYSALPASIEVPPPWRDVLGVDDSATLDAVRKAFRELATTRHPDTGAPRAEWDRIERAWQTAQEELRT